MKLIICIDDNYGIAFNNRRQSQDSLLRKRVAELSFGSSLYMSEYSAKQFNELQVSNIVIDENYLENAKTDDLCFVELVDVSRYKDKINTIIVYKWNRKYPSDIKFSLDLSLWKLKSTFEFEGSSHEKITEEVYVK